MVRVVHAMRDRQPREYQASLGAGRVGDLPTSIKMSLHMQARSLFGEERGGMPSGVADAWGSGGPEEGGQSTPSGHTP
eukprot:6611123-Prymnesium_polylepis.1